MDLRSFRWRWHAAFLGVLIAVLSATASGASAAPGGPPNGIYTCAWISANPAAALQAHVTCDPATFFAAMAGKLPGEPAPSAQVRRLALARRASTVCPFVPNGYRVGQGVFAWSDYFLTTYFNWWGTYSPADYTWYIQETDGTNIVHGNDYDTSLHSQNGLANLYYRWGAQNHSSTAQEWQICTQ